MRRAQSPIKRRGMIWALRMLLVNYALLCLCAGIGLGHISVHMPKHLAGNFADVQRRWTQNFGAEPQNVEVLAADGATMRAWYAAPARGNGRSVMLLHGIGANREDMSGFADMFLAQGYAVLLPDSRAHGASGGDLLTYGILERDDVRRWTEWLGRRQPGCTFLLGESMGAAIGLQATAATPQLCAVAVEDPYAHVRELAPERMGNATHTSTLLWETLARPVIEVAILYVRVRYGLWLPRADPQQAVEQSNVPALFITGTKDLNIPMHHAEELQRACRARCELWVVPGAGHGGASSVAGTEFDRRILQWFAAHDSEHAPMRS